MIQKKICLIGPYAVGKTSLVERFVSSIFSDKYHATIGVKIDKKVLGAGGREVNLVIWDLAGEDEFVNVDLKYMRGASGYLLVADGTRRSTLDRAFAMQQRAAEKIGPVPFLLLVNKADLKEDWELTDAELEEFARRGWKVILTSAKTGHGVEEAFVSLAESMLPPS